MDTVKPSDRIQSCIDHIKSAIDVDPWAAELAEKALRAYREPRVMTLEEVLEHYSLPPVVLDDLGWQENYLQDIEPLYFDFPVEDSWAVHWRGYQQVRKYLEDWRASYGQNWRCWTSRPTDEQRKAAKWE